jgi:uncharacterized paraquat-inducible protein A
MSKTLIAALGAALLVGVVGCQHDKTTTKSDGDVTVRTEKTDTSTMKGQDDCPMCEGVQHARADGTCPQCGMKVKPARTTTTTTP